jgi:hypothetical protein
MHTAGMFLLTANDPKSLPRNTLLETGRAMQNASDEGKSDLSI